MVLGYAIRFFYVNRFMNFTKRILNPTNKNIKLKINVCLSIDNRDLLDHPEIVENEDHLVDKAL
jgi:hypothetical protein